jgi:uncharacterized protein (TIGR03083 family)
MRLTVRARHSGSLAARTDVRSPAVADTMRVQAAIAAEQQDFVELLRGLTGEQFAAPSLCAGWSVRDVTIHVAWHVHLRPSAYAQDVAQFGAFGGARFETKLLEREGARTDGELIDWFASPPRVNANNLGELIVHQQDVRRPLGAERVVAADRLVWALDYCLTRKGGGYFGIGGGSYKRARDLRLVATDIGWSSGSGPELRGPGEAILMAINGRDVGDALEGPGLEILAGAVD